MFWQSRWNNSNQHPRAYNDTTTALQENVDGQIVKITNYDKRFAPRGKFLLLSSRIILNLYKRLRTLAQEISKEENDVYVVTQIRVTVKEGRAGCYQPLFIAVAASFVVLFKCIKPRILCHKPDLRPSHTLISQSDYSVAVRRTQTAECYWSEKSFLFGHH